MPCKTTAVFVQQILYLELIDHMCCPFEWWSFSLGCEHVMLKCLIKDMQRLVSFQVAFNVVLLNPCLFACVYVFVCIHSFQGLLTQRHNERSPEQEKIEKMRLVCLRSSFCTIPLCLMLCSTEFFCFFL